MTFIDGFIKIATITPGEPMVAPPQKPGDSMDEQDAVSEEHPDKKKKKKK